ncbi:MAG: N-6 DNA methylase [Bacteroidales bacterium]|nr:N-6 DNA methylase [Bacteroidales bacterium]
MNTDSIKNRFAQVFENDYQGYEYFIENVVKQIFTGDDAYEPLPVPEEYLTGEKRQRANESGILSILKVGTVDAEEPVDLYDITLSDRKELQYNRVGIQQFIRSELFSFTNAFMLFHNETPEGKDWRFSYAYKETTQKSMTSAKRYTYLFGKNLRARTASERFAKLAGEDKNTQNLLNAFSVEALSKDFFNEYKNQYNLFCKFISDHKNNPEFFGSKMAYWEDKSLRDYVKKMMGRITFIYFLQRKGWINGDMQYMQNAFQKSPHQDDYLDMFLEPLFFGVLNTKQKDRKTLFEKEGWDLSLLKEWKDVPYLNGGLFERDEHDQPKSKFPAEMFKNLFDFYARYNFTIDENDPDDAEVGVDPEMLGHIFENLLEDNKDKGAFYTPKEIVQYMCRESLIAYLTNCAEENTGHKYPHEQTEASVRTLVQTPEQIVPKMSHRQKEDFGKALREVKICDPAIGSGAFPMGLLNELVRLRISIGAWADKANDIAALKREIIQNNIYGVDIEKGAVDIARLRFWLSIVVDSEQPEALPNFDYKFMQGNSLLESFDGFDLSHIMDNHTEVQSDKSKKLSYQRKIGGNENIQLKMDFTTEDTRENLNIWLKKYFSIDNHKEKTEYRTLINESVKNYIRHQGIKADTEAKLSALDPSANQEFFLWHTWFKDVFDKGGFDIVIGNPPYGAKLSNKEKETYRLLFPETQFKIDTYSLFTLFALSLLNTEGICYYILPNTLLDNYFEENVRRQLLSQQIYEINDLSDKVFDAAVVHSMIFAFIKKQMSTYHIKVNTADQLYGKTKIIPSDFFHSQPQHTFAIRTYETNDLLTKLRKNSVKLFDVIDIRQAIKSGNDKLYLSKEKLNSNYKPILRGKDIMKYIISDPKLYINYGKHLACPRNHEIFEQPKILIREAGAEITATYDDCNYYIMSSLYNAILRNNKFSLKYVLGLLNSKLFQFIMYKMTFEKTKGAFTKAKIFHYYELPVYNCSFTQQEPIITLIDKILSAKKENPQADTSVWEREIDLIVYKLYGLNYEEVLVVDPETEVTREEYESGSQVVNQIKNNL